MILKFFTSLLALVSSFFGLNNLFVSDGKPHDMSPSNRLSSDLMPAKSATIPLPADTHPITEAEIDTFLSYTWHSTAADYDSFSLILTNPQRKVPQRVKDEFNGQVPSHFKEASIGSACIGGNMGVWFEGSIMHTTKWGYRSSINCGDNLNRLAKELMGYVEGNPTIYANADFSRVYLVLSDGKASEWVKDKYQRTN